VVAFHESRARIRIPYAPARTSKSYAAAMDALYAGLPRFTRVDGRTYPVGPEPGRHQYVIWPVAPTYSLAKEFDYMFQEIVGKDAYVPYGGKVLQKSNSPQHGNMRCLVAWGRDPQGTPVTTLIDGKSATNPESLQAEEVDYALMGEAAEQPHIIWSRYLSTRAKRGVMPTTPKLSAEWLYTMIEDGRKSPELSVEAFRFTPRCNPRYQWERFWQEHLKATARVVGRVEVAARHDCFDETVPCVARRDPWFAEQFLGEWTWEQDRVLPFRWTGENSNVIDYLPQWVPYGRHFVSIDYGYTDPAVALWWALGTDGQKVIYREIYETGLEPDAFAERIRKHLDDPKVEGLIGDPRNPVANQYLRRIGLPVYVPNAKVMRERKASAMMLIDALTPDAGVGHPLLRVLSEGPSGLGCPKTIAEWKTLRRKPEARDEFAAGTITSEDHAYDAARHFLAANPVAPTREMWSADEEVERHIAKLRQRRGLSARPLHAVRRAAGWR
jgi:hypothetical protein